MSFGRRGMAPNVRPDREIQHTSDALSRDIHSLLYILLATFPDVVYTSVLYRSPTFALTIGKISIFRSVTQDRETK